MNVLMVHNSYRHFGGEDVSTQSEIDLLTRNHHAVTTLLRSNDDIVEAAGFVMRARLAISTLWNESAKRLVAAEVLSTNADVMHVQNFFPLFSPAIHSGARAAGAATVQHLRNYRLMCFNGFVRDNSICELCLGKAPLAGVRYKCYRGSRSASTVFAAMLLLHRTLGTWDRDVDAFVVNTEFSRAKFVEAGLPRERLHVKPNFLMGDPGSTDPALGRFVAYVGRLEQKKGVITLLDAWRHLKGIPLKIIGDGPMLSELTDRVDGSPLASDVQFLGRLEHARVLHVLSEAGLLVMPSEWYETFGRTMMEAFALGIPVVASRMGAMEEVVDPERTGWHFNPGDPTDLAATIEAAWNDTSERRRRGREARAEFEEKYTADTNYTRLMEIYEHALERRWRR
jgi:glycosyltransferase involved in cell wall biosynthesis